MGTLSDPLTHALYLSYALEIKTETIMVLVTAGFLMPVYSQTHTGVQ